MSALWIDVTHRYFFKEKTHSHLFDHLLSFHPFMHSLAEFLPCAPCLGMPGDINKHKHGSSRTFGP